MWKLHNSARPACRVWCTFGEDCALKTNIKSVLCGYSSQTLYEDGNDVIHGWNLVKAGWLSEQGLYLMADVCSACKNNICDWYYLDSRQAQISWYFVCHGLLDDAGFPAITWDNCLSTGKKLKIPWTVLRYAPTKVTSAKDTSRCQTTL